MGIPCTDASFIFGDNKLVLNNVSMPDCVLKKKCHSIAYNFAHEGGLLGKNVVDFVCEYQGQHCQSFEKNTTW